MDLQNIEKYSHKTVLRKIREEVNSKEDLLYKLIDKSIEWKQEYLKGNIGKVYDSKTNRLTLLNNSTFQDISKAIIFSTVFFEEAQTYQTFVSHVNSQVVINTMSDLDKLKTVAEIVGYCKGIVYNIQRPITTGDKYKVLPLMQISQELRDDLHSCFFLPPCTDNSIKRWVNKYSGGTLFARERAILGEKFNMHDEYIDLSTLNILQKVSYKLTDISKTSQGINPSLKDKDILIAERLLKRTNEILSEYQDKEFQFVFQFDKRGRIYSKGYDINIQGDEYRKASIEFARKEKLTPRGIYWLKIELANHYGLDKETFDKRVAFIDNNIDDMLANRHEYISKAEEPLLFSKTLSAYVKGVVNKEPIGNITHLDATTSGPQIMSVLMRDVKAMKYLNVIGDSVRYDYYTLVAEELHRRVPKSYLWSNIKDFSEIRSIVKKPIMTAYYNSTTKPKEILGTGVELREFYNILNTLTSGAMKLREIINSLWDDDTCVYSWHLPDRHTSYCPVTSSSIKRIEVKEMDAVCNFLIQEVSPNNNSCRSLAPNIVHSIDGYICRTIVKRLYKKGIEVSPIHDSFGVHPNYCDELRREYRKVLAKLYASDCILDILRELEYDGGDFRQDFDKTVYKEILNNSNGYYIC